jgi:hypothetical protein
MSRTCIVCGNAETVQKRGYTAQKKEPDQDGSNGRPDAWLAGTREARSVIKELQQWLLYICTGTAHSATAPARHRQPQGERLSLWHRDNGHGPWTETWSWDKRPCRPLICLWIRAPASPSLQLRQRNSAMHAAVNVGRAARNVAVTPCPGSTSHAQRVTEITELRTISERSADPLLRPAMCRAPEPMLRP